MAVEIPVYIDIEGAFEQAARNVKPSMQTLQSAINKEQINLFPLIDEELKKLNIMRDRLKALQTAMKGMMSEKEMKRFVPVDQVEKFLGVLTEAQITLNQATNLRPYAESLSRADFELLQMREHYKALEESSLKMSDSIKGYQTRLREINDQWARLTVSQKFGADGSMTKEAAELYAQFKKETQELEKQGKTLDQILQKEQRRLHENQILASSTKSIAVLQEQARILSDRLSKAAVGTKEFTDYSARLRTVQNELRRVQAEANGVNTALRTQSGILRSLTSYASMYVSVFGAFRLVKQIRDVTGELEYQRVALGHLLQDVSKGNALFERIKEAAIESPFRIKDLVTYTKQLAAYRIEQEALFSTTKRLADISAGLGVDMDRLILAFGQVRASSVLRGQELRQFTEAGIPLVEMLAEKFTDLRGEMVSTADVFKLISERAVPFSMISDIFEDLTEKGGMFYKMQEEQAKTLKGRWEKLKDAYDVALQSVGDTETFQKTNDIVLGVLRYIADNLRVIIKLVDSAVVSWAAYNAVMLIAGKRTKAVATAEQAAAIAESVRSKQISGIIIKIMGQTAAEKALSAATTQATIGTTALSRALGRLKVALLTNPWVLAATAVLGLILALSRYKKVTDEAAEATNALNRAVDDMHAENAKHQRIEKIIQQYEKLAQVSELNVAQSESLARATQKLAAEFPEYKDRLEDSNLSLEDRLKLIEEINDEEAERLKNIKKEKEETLRASETKLSYASEEAEAAHQAQVTATTYYNELQATLDNLSSQGKKGRGAFAKLLFGQNEYDIVYSALARQRTVLDEAEASADKAEKNVKDLTNGIKDLRRELYGYEGEVDGTLKGWKELLEQMQLASNGSQIFTNEQLEGWNRLYDVSNDLEKEWKKLVEDLAAMKAAQSEVDPDFLEEWLSDIADLEAKIKGHELIKSVFGFTWGKTGKSSAYQQDPFINTMQERIKYMQDFKKGYDDLSKYVSKQRALEKEASIMQSRGLALGIDVSQQKRAAEGLSKWYEDAINDVFDKAKAHGATGTVESFLSQVINDTTNRGKALKDFQKLMQSLFDAKTDFDISQQKQQLELALKDLSNEVKRSETARNFYNNMLDLTGDEKLSADLTMNVYGSVGKDFKERMQDQLFGALESIGKDDIDTDFLNELLGDITIFDVDHIRENLKKIPESIRPVFEQVLEDNQKFNSDWMLDFEKTYTKAMSYQQRVDRLQAQRTMKEQEATKMGKSPEEVARVTEYYNRQIAQVQLEAMKDTYTWTKAFEDLEGVSTQTLGNLIDLIDEYVTKYAKDLEPQQLKELTRAREQAEAQIIQRNAFKATSSAIVKLISRRKALNTLEAIGLKTEKGIAVVADETQKAIKDLADALSEAESEINEYISSAKDLMSVFATSDDASYFGEQLDNLSKTMSGIKKAGIGVAQLATGQITPQAIMQTATGIADIVSSIFGAANAAQARKVTKEIDNQNRLVEDLEESYDNLSRAMDKAFGNDYVYNYSQQLENLIAQQEAYQKQVDTLNEASSSAKTKKKKEEFREQAQEAEKEVRKVGTAIDDLKNTASSFFAGEDLSSAAESFADAWLSAYQEFGDTSQAIEERMTEMVQNIMKKAALSGIAESVLGGWYESLADVQDWNAQTIAEKWREAMALVDPMVQGMQTFANSMQAEGMSLRQLPGQFTGIKRDLAGASEESINGLAVGFNVASSYLSFINDNVAAILAYLTGGAVTPASTATGAASDPYKDTVLLNLASLPQMRDDLYEIRRLLSNVIKPTGTTATHYVATNL